MTSEEELPKYAFIEHRPEFAEEVKEGDIIVAGKNFGCGSSREYAPQALKRCGVGAIIAPSFARIFFRNALNLGLLLFEAVGVAEAVVDGEEAILDQETPELRCGGRSFRLNRPPRLVHEILKEGTIVDFFRKHRRFPGAEGD
jgi:methanogen homoaconitase small subunit